MLFFFFFLLTLIRVQMQGWPRLDWGEERHLWDLCHGSSDTSERVGIHLLSHQISASIRAELNSVLYRRLEQLDEMAAGSENGGCKCGSNCPCDPCNCKWGQQQLVWRLGVLLFSAKGKIYIIIIRVHDLFCILLDVVLCCVLLDVHLNLLLSVLVFYICVESK